MDGYSILLEFKGGSKQFLFLDMVVFPSDSVVVWVGFVPMSVGIDGPNGRKTMLIGITRGAEHFNIKYFIEPNIFQI